MSEYYMINNEIYYSKIKNSNIIFGIPDKNWRKNKNITSQITNPNVITFRIYSICWMLTFVEFKFDNVLYRFSFELFYIMNIKNTIDFDLIVNCHKYKNINFIQ